MMYGNTVLSTKKDILEAMITTALNIGSMSSSLDIIEKVGKLISLGILQYWNSALLLVGPVAKPPPGSILVTKNIITNPGLPLPIKLKNSDTYDEMPKCLSGLMKIHLLSVGGTTTSNVMVGTVVTPIEFPWIGYK